ncbi:MAG: DUF2993 domain-containing protein [Candidatus Nanopelagicales bacterium]
MKKVLAVVGVVLAVLVVAVVVVDRAGAAIVERQVSQSISSEVAGVGSVDTQVHGVPLITQALGGSLDHVTVDLTDVPATEKLTLDTVQVELYDVTTTSPRTAAKVDAVATLGPQALAAELGDAWKVSTADGALVISLASGLPAEARIVPTVRDGAIALDLQSVNVLGIEVSGDSIPDVVKNAVSGLAGSIGKLPLGLEPQSIAVTPAGLELRATGTDVDLEAGTA